MVEEIKKRFKERLEAEERLLNRQAAGELTWGPYHGPHSRGACWTNYYYTTWVTHYGHGHPKGHCKWCGEPTPGLKRAWHTECVEEFQAIHWWNTSTWMLDRGLGNSHRTQCALCGEECRPEWDHRLALSLAGHDVTAHFLSNIQPLCHKCHATKTGEDRRKLNLARKRQQEAKPAASLFEEGP
jgi:hypothetical protein